jgi:hypothetical protein
MSDIDRKLPMAEPRGILASRYLRSEAASPLQASFAPQPCHPSTQSVFLKVDIVHSTRLLGLRQ